MSMICLVHCLALPLLVLVLPGPLSLLFGSENFHILAIAVIAPMAVLAFGMGVRFHGALCPSFVGGAGLAFLVLALWPALDHVTSVAVTVAGSLMLVAGHVLNWRLRSRAA